METILDIPEGERVQETVLFGDLRPPPMAKCDPPSFVDVSKSAAVVPPPSSSHTLKWFLLILVAALLVLMYIAPAAEAVPDPNVTLPEDPLNDLLRVFMGQGVELSDDGCLACFFSDTGRVRKSQGATEAFVVYKTDSSINFFEVVTHVFNPPSDFPEGFAPAPFSFWMSADDDADGEPDSWEPLQAEYKKMGSVMGWEKGAFFNAMPPMPFFKVTFHDVEGSWRPQVGNVLLVPENQEAMTVTLADQVNGEEEPQPSDLENVLVLPSEEAVGAMSK